VIAEWAELPADEPGRCRCGPRAAGGRCPLCGEAVAAAEPTPAEVVPFTVGPEAAQRALARWLGGGWFHPWRLSRILRSRSLRAVYVPCWVLRADVDAEWRGRVGRERVDRVHVDPAQRGDSRTWVTATVTDWRWQTGRRRQPGAVHLVAAHAPFPEAWQGAPTPDAGAQPLEVAAEALPATVSLGTASSLARGALRESARAACRAELPTELVRELQVDVDLTGEQWSLVVVPAWVATWWDGDQLRHVWCHGRTGEVVGARPVDWRAVRVVSTLALAPGVLAVVAGVPLLVVFAVGVPTMLFGLSALAVGSLVSVVAWSAALASEQE
jgi:hypothetical protein